MKQPTAKRSLPILQMRVTLEEGKAIGIIKLINKTPMMTIRPLRPDSRKASTIRTMATSEPMSAYGNCIIAMTLG